MPVLVLQDTKKGRGREKKKKKKVPRLSLSRLNSALPHSIQPDPQDLLTSVTELSNLVKRDWSILLP